MSTEIASRKTEMTASETPAFDRRAVSPPAKRPIMSYETITVLLPIIDLAIILASSVLATVLVATFYAPSTSASITSLYGLGLVASALYVFCMRDLDHYEAHVARAGGIEFKQMAQTWAASVLVLLTLIYMFKLGQLNTRRTFIAFILLAFVALIGWRAMVKVGLRYAVDRNAVGRRNVLLIGETDELQARDLDLVLDHFGVANVARFPIAGGSDGALSPEDQRVIDRAVAHAREMASEEALVIASWSNTKRLNQLREALRILPISARLLPDRQIRKLTAFPTLNSEQTFQVELQRAPLTSFEQGVKRAMDIVLSGIGLILLSPLLTIVALMIRLESPGPAIFRQRRIGFNRTEFTIYKFRTMRVQEDGSAVRQATRGDARITRLGRFLRASSIDELPQLFNVLRGDMSLVGPRPHAIVHDNEFASELADYAFRRHMKPGITGWAQCKGERGPTPTVESVRARVDLDLWYITNWSVSLDIYILFKIVLVAFNQKTAL